MEAVIRHRVSPGAPVSNPAGVSTGIAVVSRLSARRTPSRLDEMQSLDWQEIRHTDCEVEDLSVAWTLLETSAD